MDRTDFQALAAEVAAAIDRLARVPRTERTTPADRALKPGWCVPDERARWACLTPEQRHAEMRDAIREAREAGSEFFMAGGELIPMLVPVPVPTDGMWGLPPVTASEAQPDE